MAEGMPKPRKPESTYDTIKNRGRNLDAMIEEAETGEVKPQPAKAEPKGLPKPGLLERAKKFITGK